MQYSLGAKVLDAGDELPIEVTTTSHPSGADYAAYLAIVGMITGSV